MNELDRQIAEMQGWKIVELMQGPTWDDTDERGFHNALLVSDYTPSTNLNQAIAAAEWALANHCEYINIEASNDKLRDASPHWLVSVMDWGEEFHRADADSLAEAICQALLKAVKGGST